MWALLCIRMGYPDVGESSRRYDVLMVHIKMKWLTNDHQVLATMAKNLSTLDIGISISFATIVIPSIRHLQHRSVLITDPLYLTNDEITWYGKFFSCLFVSLCI